MYENMHLTIQTCFNATLATILKKNSDEVSDAFVLKFLTWMIVTAWIELENAPNVIN